MTLFELMFLLLCLAAGVGGAMSGGALFGVPGYLGGFIAGVFLLPGLGAAYFTIDSRLFMGPPGFPPCRCGKGSDELQLDQDDADRFVMRCACGARYWRRRGRIYRLEAGRGPAPHVRWHPIRGWILDPDRGDAHDDTPYR